MSEPGPMPAQPRLDAAELVALAEKYEALAALQRAQSAGLPPPSRAHFQALAWRFPGCLRELDRLPLEELERRARGCRVAADGGSLEAWMPWSSRFHALLRASVAARQALVGPARTRRSLHLCALDLDALARRLSIHQQLVIDRDLLGRLLEPAHGRVVPVVIDEIARRFEVDPRDVEDALLPSPRRGRALRAPGTGAPVG